MGLLDSPNGRRDVEEATEVGRRHRDALPEPVTRAELLGIFLGRDANDSPQDEEVLYAAYLSGWRTPSVGAE